MAHEIGAKVTGYHAIEDPFRGDILSEGFVIDAKVRTEFERRARERAQVPFDVMGKLAKAAGVAFDSAVTNVDTPYKGIIEVARKRALPAFRRPSHPRV